MANLGLFMQKHLLESRNPANTFCASGVSGAATPSGMLSIFLEEIGEFREE